MTPAADGVEGDEAAGGAGVPLRPGRLGRVRHLQVSRLSAFYHYITAHYCGQAGRGGRGLPAVGGRILGQRQRLPLSSQRVQVLHHRQVRHATRDYTCVTKKLHVAGTMTRRPTAAPAPRPTEAGGGSTGKLVWLIDILLTPHGFESSTRNMLKKTANI